jgi:hypothetical protein
MLDNMAGERTRSKIIGIPLTFGGLGLLPDGADGANIERKPDAFVGSSLGAGALMGAWVAVGADGTSLSPPAFGPDPLLATRLPGGRSCGR